MFKKSDELKDRIGARKHELLMKADELKADTRAEAIQARAKLKSKIDELEGYLKEGWDRVSEATAAKLDKWLERD
jgi:hypothetical protein